RKLYLAARDYRPAADNRIKNKAYPFTVGTACKHHLGRWIRAENSVYGPPGIIKVALRGNPYQIQVCIIVCLERTYVTPVRLFTFPAHACERIYDHLCIFSHFGNDVLAEIVRA